MTVKMNMTVVEQKENVVKHETCMVLDATRRRIELVETKQTLTKVSFTTTNLLVLYHANAIKNVFYDGAPRRNTHNELVQYG